MGHVYHKHLVEGVTIPAIIHNLNYYLIQMAVYENGTVSCWKRSDLNQFHEDLIKGWVVPRIPTYDKISVHGLGFFQIRAASWKYSKNEYYRHVTDIVHSLNPEMTNLYQASEREIAKWKKARVSWMDSPIPCKIKSPYGYTLIDGKSFYIFYRKENSIYLTPLTVYADKTIKIEAAGKQTFSQNDLEELFASNILCTSPENEETVIIEGLGEIVLAKPRDILSVKDKLAEFADAISMVSGEKDSLDRCQEAHYQYLINPNDITREQLRKAYETVPEHMRMYLGDMDTRDSDIIRILNYPDTKREV